MPARIHDFVVPHGSRFGEWHKPGDVVVDVGCGGDPYKYATVLVDKYPTDNKQRGVSLKLTPGIPFIEADVAALPFADKSVDFLFCKHVMEHVEDPDAACREIIRVAKRGYLEFPTRLWERLFTRRHDEHRWVIDPVPAAGGVVCLNFTRNPYPNTTKDFFDRLFANDKAFQVLFWNNYPMWLTCIYWEGGFEWTTEQRGEI